MNLIDLTHTLREDIPYWDDSCGFESHLLLDHQQCTTKTKFRNLEFKMKGGIGTHMDAPLHCIPNAKDIASIHVQDFVISLNVIDVSKIAHSDYLLNIQEINNYEKKYGMIKKNSFVAIYTGWSRKWNDKTAYRNEDQNHKMHFPGLLPETAEFLIGREVIGVGIDTLSPEGTNDDFPVHQILLSKGKYIVENLAHLDQMPAAGAFIVVLPLKIEGATESPIRAIGIIF